MYPNLDIFLAALEVEAVETAKRGVRVYPSEGRISVLVGSGERRRAAKAIGAAVAPDQPTGDRTSYIRLPTCILLEGRSLPLVRESVVRISVPRGFELWWAGDACRLRPCRSLA